VVNVADFGAVGDGVTNDTAAIQAAIDYAISVGNAIVEFNPKKYNLTSVFNNTVPNTMNTVNGYVSKHHLRITGGTTSLKLFFKGNGATLYTNVSPNFASNTIAQVIYTATDFNTIEFENLTIERGPARITDAPNWTFQEMGFGAFCVSANRCNKLAFYNVTFINNTQFINGMWFYGGNSAKRLREVIFSKCTWLYPYASNRISVANGGGWGVSIYFDQWTENALFEGCYVDMASAGSYPNDVAGMRDGFNVGSAVHTQFSHCTLKNNYIETLFSFGGQFDLPTLAGSIVWPADGANINVTLGVNAINSRVSYVAGQKLLMLPRIPTDRGVWLAGLFEFVSATATPFQNGTVLTLKKLPDALIPAASFYTNQRATVGTTYNLTSPYAWGIQNFDIENQHATTINNCRFEGNNIRRENGTSKLQFFQVKTGGSGYTSAPSVVITPDGGIAASATISGGQVTGISITTPNYDGDNTKGYFVEPPVVSFSGGGGGGATAIGVLYSCQPAPAIYTRNNCLINDCTFYDVGSAIFTRANTSRQGPTTICNNTFIFDNNFTSPETMGTVGNLWHDFLIFANNIIVGKKPLIPAAIGGRYSKFVNNQIVHQTKDAANKPVTAAFSLINTISPCNITMADNYCVGVDQIVSASGGNSYILDSYKGSDQRVPTDGNSVAFRSIAVDFRPTRSGWVRLNPLYSGTFLNRGTCALYTIGGLSFSVSANNADATATISVLGADRRLPISKVRVLKDGGIIWIEVYVPDHTYFATASAIQCRVFSEEASGLLSNPVSYTAISAIVADGADALVTATGHGLKTGEWVYINDTNSTPVINGNRRVASATTNTFKISGITVTSSGSAGEVISSIRNNNRLINITSIIQKGSDVTVTHDGDPTRGENPANGFNVHIQGSDSIPSLDGARVVINSGNFRFDVAGVTLTQVGTRAGTFFREQDYATNASVVAQIDLNNASDLYALKNISVGQSQILSGTNAPAGEAPDGSIYLRTNGDSSTTIYVRSASTWTAIS
jgi:hypothetical protein